MAAPCVSVAIPAFNPGTFLVRALDSVRAQSFGDWECLVVDDGGHEDLSYVEQMDPRIRLCRQDNRGTSAARNVALLRTTGPYIAYLDQDDEWHPDKLAVQVEILRADTSIGLCDTNFDIVKDGEVIASGYGDHGGSYARLLVDAAIGLSTVLARRDAVAAAGGFNPCLRIMQDHDLFLRLAMMGWRMVRAEQCLARYYRHGENTSDDYALARREHDAVLLEHRLRATWRHDAAALEAIKQGRAAWSELFAAQALDTYRQGGGASHLVQAARFSPGATSRAALQAARGRAAGLLTTKRR